MQYEAVESLRDAKTQINMYLSITNFADKDLAKLSMNLQAALDIYDRSAMSDRDRQAYDCRHALNMAFEKIDALEKRCYNAKQVKD